MKGWNAGEGTGSAKKFRNTMAPNQQMMGNRMGAMGPMMYDKTWEGAKDASEGQVSDWTAERRKIKAKYKGTKDPKGYKNDPAYQAVQNKINKAYGVDKRHGKATAESKEGKKNVKTTTVPGEYTSTETQHRGEKSIAGSKKTTKKDYVDTPMEDRKSKEVKEKKEKKKTLTTYKDDSARKEKDKKRKDKEIRTDTEGKKQAKYKYKYDKEDVSTKDKATYYDDKGKVKGKKKTKYGPGGWYGDDIKKEKIVQKKDDIVAKKITKKDKDGEMVTRTKTRKKWGTGLGSQLKEKLANRKNKNKNE